ncbi:MAG: arsenate reductase/protein-tyrosine-phosphatase family protein [Candidatus Limnocylindrales bacterium]
MKVAELARGAGVAPSAVRFYEETGVLPPAPRLGNGYREYGAGDLARLRLIVVLRRLGLAPVDAGRLAALCVERGEIDRDLAPLIAGQRAAMERQRADLDRLDSELNDLESTIQAAGRARLTSKEADMSADPMRVLFVCTGNSARSQIAEALLKDFGGPEFAVFSAGTQPKGVNPYTTRVLGEIGLDWSGARSKSVTDFLGQPFDYVITVCDRARQTCPVFPGQHNSLHWGLDDPAEVEGTDEDKLEAFRRTRTEVATRLRPFVELARRARSTAAGAASTKS